MALFSRGGLTHLYLIACRDFGCLKMQTRNCRNYPTKPAKEIVLYRANWGICEPVVGSQHWKYHIFCQFSRFWRQKSDTHCGKVWLCERDLLSTYRPRCCESLLETSGNQMLKRASLVRNFESHSADSHNHLFRNMAVTSNMLAAITFAARIESAIWIPDTVKFLPGMPMVTAVSPQSLQWRWKITISERG